MPNRPLSPALKKQALAAVKKHGTPTAAARALGISRTTLDARLQAAGYVRPVRTKSAVRLLAEETGIPEMTLRSRILAAQRPERSEPPSPSVPERTPTLGISTSPVELQAEVDRLRGELEAVTQVKRWIAAAPTTEPRATGTKHMYIPDAQVKCGVPIAHLIAAGKYALLKRPDVIILGGDWWDMPSLSSYDKGKLKFEGRRYRLDIEAGKHALIAFLNEVRKDGYNPRIVFTMGNHEERIERMRQEHPVLSDMISFADLCLEQLGIEVVEFLKVVKIDGVSYCHFFPRAASGKVMQSKNGAPNSKAQLVREGRSAVAGHTQGLDVHCQDLDGKVQWGIIAGSFYQHPEGYLTPQGNTHWQGLVMLHDVRDGEFDPMFVSLNYLLKRFA